MSQSEETLGNKRPPTTRLANPEGANPNNKKKNAANPDARETHETFCKAGGKR